MDKRFKVAIIGGTGKMGWWFADFLANDGTDVVVAGRNAEKLKLINRPGIETTTDLAAAVKQSDALVVSVPIDSFEAVVKQLRPYVKTGQIVIDVTSVKTMPVEAMHRYLPQCSVLGAHPVFGPGAKGMRNQNVVLTPTDEKETALAEKVRNFLETRGARVSIMTPEAHDEMIAVILGLAHFIAIVSADALLGFDKLKDMSAIAGPTYKVLLTLAESVLTEDPELYGSIQMNLPRMAEVEERFLKSSHTWADIVKNKDKQAFVQRMNGLKEMMSRNNPDFGKSYQAMYKILDDR